MPRAIPGSQHLPSQPATVFVSAADKWRRLSPWASDQWDVRTSAPRRTYQEYEARASWWSSSSWSYRYRPYTSGSWSSWHSPPPDDSQPDHEYSWHDAKQATATRQPSLRPRSDVPAVRNLVRGTTADALNALRALGMEALINALNTDRYAASSADSNRSHLKT